MSSVAQLEAEISTGRVPKKIINPVVIKLGSVQISYHSPIGRGEFKKKLQNPVLKEIYDRYSSEI